MTLYSKDVIFKGIEDSFPDEAKAGAIELGRRLEQMQGSLMHQLRRQPTVFTNVSDDAPSGMMSGDVWFHRDGTFQVYDGISWVP